MYNRYHSILSHIFVSRYLRHFISQGPVVIENPSYKKNKAGTGHPFVQIGVVSWGEDCADHIFPGGTNILVLIKIFLLW